MDSTNHPPLNHEPVNIVAVIFVLFIVAGLITAFVFYLLTLQRALNRCSPENRAMQPSLVWLMLIPCFSIIWHFFVVFGMAKSLGAEFQKRGIAKEPQPGKVIGLVMCSLNCVSDVCGAIGLIPILGLPFLLGKIVFGFAFLVCWVIYWVNIAAASKKLAP